jgi:drug/metabolite transporter (DMT)-like permease
MHRRAVAILLVVNLLWGISFPVMKATNQLIDRHQMGSGGGRLHGTEAGEPASKVVPQVRAACFLIILRFTIALMLLVLFLPRLFRGMTPDHWRMGAWTGLTFGAGFVFQIMGLNYVPASRSGFLTSLTVVFTPLALILIERRRPRWLVAAGAAAALVGTAILTGMVQLGQPWGVRLADDAFARVGPGDWLTVAGAVIFTGQILLIDTFSRRMPAGQLTPGMFAATLLVAMIVFGGVQSAQPSPGGFIVWAELLVDIPFLAMVLVLSIFCTVLAFHWMNKYQSHVTPAQAALIYTSEPIFATLWAMFLPDLISRVSGLAYRSERPGLELALGGLLVVAGNALALWPEQKSSENMA